MAVIQTMGQTQGGGIKESLAKFRNHNTEESGQILNISGIDTLTGLPVDKDDPRQPYVKQSFPAMLYHAEKKPAIGVCEPGEAVAVDEVEMKALMAKGYRDTPYPRPQVHLEDPKAEKAALQKELTQKDGEIAQLNDVLSRAMARLDALEAKGADDPKKK